MEIVIATLARTEAAERALMHEAELEREISACLDLIPAPYRVLVREGGGYLNESAALAVSVAKLIEEIVGMQRKLKVAERELTDVTEQLRQWYASRERLSSDCASLGISGHADDTGWWGLELANGNESLDSLFPEIFPISSLC